MVRNLPEVKPKIPLLGVSSTDIPLQGASTYSKPTGGSLGHLLSRVGALRLAKKALSRCTRRRLKKSKSKGKRSSNQEMQVRQSREKLQTKHPRGQGQRAVPPQKWPELQKGPGTYKEAPTNIKIAIFRETYPEDKLNEDDQNYILEELGRVLRRTPT
jgi:hypothetical protein